jgi:hypothetical protein
VAVFLFAAWQASRRRRDLQVVPAPLPDNMALRYRPMERLLDEGDIRFLASRPDYDPRTARRLRAERRRIFRAYLRHMQRDFNRVSTALHAVLLEAGQDRPELARELFNLQLTFSMSLRLAYARLALHALGVGTVDVSGLVGALDGMRQTLAQLSPVPSSLAA